MALQGVLYLSILGFVESWWVITILESEKGEGVDLQHNAHAQYDTYFFDVQNSVHKMSLVWRFLCAKKCQYLICCAVPIAICVRCSCKFFRHQTNIFFFCSETTFASNSSRPRSQSYSRNYSRLDSNLSALSIQDDDDVTRERDRVTMTPVQELVDANSLLMIQLTKRYGNTLAVDRLSIGEFPLSLAGGFDPRESTIINVGATG